jgi:hypothetical protein
MGGASFNSSQRHAVDAALPLDVFGGESPSAKRTPKKYINKNANNQALRENDTQGPFYIKPKIYNFLNNTYNPFH